MPYQIDCSQEDSFMVKSEDESEAMAMIKQHAREKHGMDLSDDDARGMIENT